MTDASALAIVLINYNNEADTIDCLASLAEQTTDRFTTIVVDNGSDGDSFGQVRSSFSYPVYLENGTNEGFTGGNNTGIEYALNERFEFILLLNNDTVVDETFVKDLLASAEEAPSEVGVMGPTVHTYPDDCVWSNGGKINPWTGTTAHRVPDLSDDPPCAVDYVVGAAILVRSEVFRDIGLLDDDFFIYYEETEFCCRAKKHGWGVWHLPVSGVHHKETTEFEHSPFRDYYFTRNRFLFVRKTQSVPTFAVFVVWYLIRWLVAQTIYLTATGNTDAALETLRGGYDAVTGRTGRNR